MLVSGVQLSDSDIYAYIYTHIYTHTHTYIYIYIYTQLHTHISTYTHIWQWQFSCSVISDSLQPMDCSPPASSVHGILQARILEWQPFSSPGDFFLTQGSNLGLLCCRQILYQLSHQVSPGGLYTHIYFSDSCPIQVITEY